LKAQRKLCIGKKKCNLPHHYIIFQFLVVKPNEHQIDELKALAKEIGVDEVILKNGTGV
jgi:hypothetical protein